MKSIIHSVVLLALLGASGAAIAAERTVTLTVDNMACVTCPYTVALALEAVPGVSAVEVSFEEKTAVVTFDDEQTEIAALTAATTDAGYPSRPIDEAGK